MKLRILVIDDSPVNLQSAKDTLSGHELTLFSSHDDAYDTLNREPDYEEVSKLRKEGVDYEEASRRLMPEPFDVILTDLLMPPNLREIGSPAKQCEFENQLMGLGIGIAFHAAIHGAKHVAVFSSGKTHHCHPAVALLDPINHRRVGKIRVNDTMVSFFGDNCTDEESVPVEGTTCLDINKHVEGKTCYKCRDTGKQLGKNWAWVLEQILA